MKKNTIYTISIIVFCLAIVGIVVKYHYKQTEESNKVYGLLDRKGSSAGTPEWQLTKKRAGTLLAALQTDPADTKSALQLASLYIKEARITGNHVYYDKAAMKYINDVLTQNPNNFDALVYKSLIYMSQHHFADGLAVAHQAQQINPYNAYIYGLMVDGNVEMGQYDSAVKYADKMVSIRPDLTSYSRISYLREIFGDYKGSIAAMQQAATAGGQGDEYTEWTRTQLAALYEKTGDYKTADGLYNQSLNMRPNYAYALVGLAHVALADSDYNRAIALYQKADSIVTDNTVKEEMSDVYRRMGQTKKANEILQDVVDGLNKDAQASAADPTMGHYADRELAYDYLKLGDKDKALEHAMLEWNRRPENIDVNETVAWVYYNRGDYAKAASYMKTALKTHSKNPVLLSRAALIFYKAGDKDLAKTMLAETSLSNPYIDPSLKNETAAIESKL